MSRIRLVSMMHWWIYWCWISSSTYRLFRPKLAHAAAVCFTFENSRRAENRSCGDI